jgi:hypothetical protein
MKVTFFFSFFLGGGWGGWKLHKLKQIGKKRNGLFFLFLPFSYCCLNMNIPVYCMVRNHRIHSSRVLTLISLLDAYAFLFYFLIIQKNTKGFWQVCF